MRPITVTNRSMLFSEITTVYSEVTLKRNYFIKSGSTHIYHYAVKGKFMFYTKKITHAIEIICGSFILFAHLYSFKREKAATYFRRAFSNPPTKLLRHLILSCNEWKECPNVHFILHACMWLSEMKNIVFAGNFKTYGCRITHQGTTY